MSYNVRAVGKAAPKHLDFLDGVRGLAALYVVMHHAIVHLPMPDQLGRAEWLLRKFGGFGHYAVDVFIVLSGYCLMLPLCDGKGFELPTFLLRRALRILPAYFLAGALSLALIGSLIGAPTNTLWDHSIPVTSFDIVSHVLLVHDWIPESANKINLVFWSVGVEWKIYFVFPLLLIVLKRLGPTLMAFSTIVVSYAAWLACYYAQVFNPGPWGSSFYYVGLFALGMLAAKQGEKLGASLSERSRKLLPHCLLLLTGGIALLAYYSDERIPVQVQSLPVGIWAALLLFSLRLGALPRFISRAVSSSVPTRLGRMGYSLYLIHAPILQIVYLYLVEPMAHRAHQVPLMFVCGTLATIPVAGAFFALAEQPFHRLSRHAKKLHVATISEGLEPELPMVASSTGTSGDALKAASSCR